MFQNVEQCQIAAAVNLVIGELFRMKVLLSEYIPISVTIWYCGFAKLNWKNRIHNQIFWKKYYFENSQYKKNFSSG